MTWSPNYQSCPHFPARKTLRAPVNGRAKPASYDWSRPVAHAAPTMTAAVAAVVGAIRRRKVRQPFRPAARVPRLASRQPPPTARLHHYYFPDHAGARHYARHYYYSGSRKTRRPPQPLGPTSRLQRVRARDETSRPSSRLGVARARFRPARQR